MTTGNDTQDTSDGDGRVTEQTNSDLLPEKSADLPKPTGRRAKNRKEDVAQADSKPKKKMSRVWKIVIWSVSALLAILLSVAVYLIWNIAKASDEIFEGSIFDLVFVEAEPVKQDANGRTNILIFGTSPAGHPGAHLTDSILVMSIDNASKDSFMVSVPRDLWVEYEKSCWVGYSGKINAAYVCGRDSGESPKDGAMALSKQMTKVLGLEIQYYVHLDWDVVKKSVDALGGIEVTIKSSDSRGIYDVATGLKLTNGTHNIDGETALNLTRARNSKGGYGISDSDFGRTKNQQLVLKALQKKGLSTGTLTDLVKITNLLDALGNNLKTNIAVKELKSLIALGSEIDMDTMESIDLTAKNNKLVVGDRRGSQYIVRPVAGINNFSQIHAAISNRIKPNPIYLESAAISVINSSSVVGVENVEAEKLQGLGFNVVSYGIAESKDLKPVEVFRLGEIKSEAEAGLVELYGVEIASEYPKYLYVKDVDYLVVFSDAKEQN